MRWELNDMARRLDQQPGVVGLPDELAGTSVSSESRLSPDARRIFEAIDQLPDDEREVLELVRIQGLSQAETARVLEVSPMTVMRRLNRGLQSLASKLADLSPVLGDADMSE
jgi:RNA polymerase sigma-70 factor (ECF subfamily)